MKKYFMWIVIFLIMTTTAVFSLQTNSLADNTAVPGKLANSETGTAPATINPGDKRGYDLHQLIVLCFRENPDIAAAYEKTDSSLAKVKKAKAQGLPGVSFTGVYSHIGVIPRIEMPGFEDIDFITANMLNFALGVDYTLFDWGLTRDGVRIEELGLDSQRLSTILLKKGLVLQLSMLYYNILQVEENITVLDENISILNGIIDLLKEQFNAGIIPEHPLLQTRVTLYSLQAQQLELQKMKSEMSNSLKNLCGLPLDAPLKLQPLPADREDSAGSSPDPANPANPANPADPAALLAEAYREREDFKILRLQLQILEKSKALISKTKLPLLAASFNAELRNNIMPDVERLKTNWNIGLTVIYNIFDRNSARFDKEVLGHELQGLRFTIKKQENNLRTNLDTLRANLEMTNQKILLEEERLKIAKKSLELARDSFKESQATYLEVLQAQSAYNLAESSLISLKYRKIINLLQIDFELYPLEHFIKEQE